ncbi:MAG: T9SS type A sorting domain-containing protein, partial [Saprospiraceae bacterium]
PNPAQQCVYVSLKKEISGPVNVRLFNASGQLFYESENLGNLVQPIPVATIPVGVYFLQLEHSEGKETEKLMIAR